MCPARGCCLRRLTFEVTRPCRQDAWGARQMIGLAASRPKRPAGTGRVDRRVRRHSRDRSVKLKLSLNEPSDEVGERGGPEGRLTGFVRPADNLRFTV